MSWDSTSGSGGIGLRRRGDLQRRLGQHARTVRSEATAVGCDQQVVSASRPTLTSDGNEELRVGLSDMEVVVDPVDHRAMVGPTSKGDTVRITLTRVLADDQSKALRCLHRSART
jgi:hypothetical protein